jgi:hypothetical protein
MQEHATYRQPVARQIPVTSPDTFPDLGSQGLGYRHICPVDIQSNVFEMQLRETARDRVDSGIFGSISPSKRDEVETHWLRPDRSRMRIGLPLVPIYQAKPQRTLSGLMSEWRVQTDSPS